MTIYIVLGVMPCFLLLLSGIPLYRASSGTKPNSFFSSIPLLIPSPHTVALADLVLTTLPRLVLNSGNPSFSVSQVWDSKTLF